MIKPLKTVFFLIIVGTILAISVIALPEDGINVAGFKIHMPSFESMITKDSVSYADISDITKGLDNLDSLPDITQMIDVNNVDTNSANSAINDSIAAANAKPIKPISADALSLASTIHRIEFKDGDNSNLLKFYKKLNSANKTSVKIMHYGDSQLEGDRITSYIRNKLQKQYSGSGPGFLPALQPYNSYFSVDQSNEGNWKRYAVFGRKDTNVLHKKFGPLAAFSRFAPINNDSIFMDTANYTAAVIFEESKVAYSLVRSFQKVIIHYGNAKSPVNVKLTVDDVIVSETTLETNTSYSTYEYTLASLSKNLRIDFEGGDSPDIYGIDLKSVKGVSVDNIGMRGSSGTIFTKMDFEHLKTSYNDMEVQLFILQFGGNVMPYIKDTAQAVSYGRWFKNQLNTVKRARPDASFIVIGPSDMSYKEEDKFVTYPYLEVVRDELKKAAFKAGYGYWDMYQAMGGHNSMPSWVSAEPKLAGADYTHFTPKGAKLIANMFYNALMIEGIESKNNKVEKKIQTTDTIEKAAK